MKVRSVRRPHGSLLPETTGSLAWISPRRKSRMQRLFVLLSDADHMFSIITCPKTGADTLDRAMPIAAPKS